MATKIYGASDDLIEFEGDVRGEVNFISDDDDPGALLILSDGTLLEARYAASGIWKITLIKRGKLLDRIDQCDDPDAEVYSDVAHFKPGLKGAYAATGGWEKVK